MEDIKPLSRTRRNIYLIFLLIIFVVLVPLLVFYALGYRWDGKLGITKTGGIYVHSNLTGTEVYMDSSLKKKTGFFNRNVLFSDLYPTTYNVLIKKDGYNDWKKEVIVHPNLVTEISSINLPLLIDIVEIPERLGTSTTAKLNSKYKEVSSYFIPATSTQTVSTSTEDFDPRELYQGYVRLGKISSWIEEGNVLVVWDGPNESRPFYLCNGLDCVSTTTVDRNEDVEYFDFVPGRDDSIIIDIPDGIFVIELDNRTTANIQPILWSQNGDKLDFRVENGRVYIKNGKKLFEAKW